MSAKKEVRSIKEAVAYTNSLRQDIGTPSTNRSLGANLAELIRLQKSALDYLEQLEECLAPLLRYKEPEKEPAAKESAKNNWVDATYDMSNDGGRIIEKINNILNSLEV